MFLNVSINNTKYVIDCFGKKWNERLNKGMFKVEGTFN